MSKPLGCVAPIPAGTWMGSAGAQRMLQEAVELEVARHIEAMRDLRDELGRRLVVRNGYLPERKTCAHPAHGCLDDFLNVCYEEVV